MATTKPKRRQSYGRSARAKEWAAERLERAKDLDFCRHCFKVPAYAGLTRCLACQTRHRVIEHKSRLKVRLAALEAYGKKCAQCGETRLPCLEFDHINNDGAEHRRGRGKSPSTKLCVWLKNHGYPKDVIQILCANCHRMKHYRDGKRYHDRGEAERPVLA